MLAIWVQISVEETYFLFLIQLLQHQYEKLQPFFVSLSEYVFVLTPVLLRIALAVSWPTYQFGVGVNVPHLAKSGDSVH